MLDHDGIRALLAEGKGLRKGSSTYAEGIALVVRQPCMSGARKTFTITPLEDGRLDLAMRVDKPRRRDPSGAWKAPTTITETRAGIYPEQIGALIRGWRP